MVSSDYRFKTAPLAHQAAEFRRTRDLEYFARFWEMGTGKSKILLDEAAWLWDAGKIDTLLVVCNKGSYMSWVDDHVPKHLPDHVKRYVTYWDSTAGKRHERTYVELMKASGILRILVMNVEAFSAESGRAFKLAKRLAGVTRCLCVIDESSSIKNPKARRTKALLRLAPLFKYRRVMTGTPAANGPLNVYTQAEFLKPYLLHHSSWYSFRNEYCVLVDMKARNPSTGTLVEFKKIAGFRNLDRLKAIMAPWSSAVRKEDCLDLPPKVYETYEVELTAEQRRVYEDLRERSIAELNETQAVTAQLALTKVLRLQQVLCGYVPDEAGDLVEIEERRTTALLELLEEVDGKVVIWSRFVHPIKKIVAALKKEYGDSAAVAYFGETKDRGTVVREFQEGAARFFIGNPQTGGYGITLTAARTVVYYANSFDLEQRLQSEDRCHRLGQAGSVTYVDLVARGTVDAKILKALREKHRLQDELMAPAGWRGVL